MNATTGDRYAARMSHLSGNLSRCRRYVVTAIQIANYHSDCGRDTWDWSVRTPRIAPELK